MKKYNEVVEFHKQGLIKCQKTICSKQQMVLKRARDDAAKAAHAAVDEFTEGLEEKVKDWTSDDYDQFISMAEHDDRLDSMDILTISTAYARTHKDDEIRVHNDVCKDAMLEMAMEGVGNLLEAMGIR